MLAWRQFAKIQVNQISGTSLDVGTNFINFLIRAWLIQQSELLFQEISANLLIAWGRLKEQKLLHVTAFLPAAWCGAAD